jgi:hypothetical protein
MRKIAYGNWILLSICSGCGASTGLSEGFWDGSQGSTVSTSTGGAGAVGGGGVYWTGGASYVPSGGYGAMVATGGSPYYPTGGTTYYYPGGAKATGGSSYHTGGVSPKATGGSTYYNTGGKSYTGGNTSTGGKSATGGSKYTGGSTSTGGKSSTSTGGKSPTGGTTYNYSGGYTGTGGGSFTGAMKIATDGYVAMAANMYTLHGYVNTFADVNSSVQGSIGTRNICATGIIEPNSSYLSYAGMNINVNQTSASSGSTISSLTIDAKYITISFSNDYNAPLRFQLNSDTGTYWCYDLSGLASPVTVPLDSFRTSCWDPASGYPFKPGTAITSISMVVPGDTVSEYKYNICFYGVTFQ